MMTLTPDQFALLADTILITHAGFVVFVIVGFVVIWIGYFARWSFVRNFYFRLAHMVAMGIVAAQALLGVDCPLTVWEGRAREMAGEGPRYGESFIAHWLHRLFFFDLPPVAFTIFYTVFFLLIVLSLIVVRPRLPGRFHHDRS